MAVATYIVATEPLGAERARQLIANNAAVSDMNWVLDYFRLSADHRLLFGGRVNYSGSAPSMPQRNPRAHARRVSAIAGRAHRLPLGRRSRHHAQSSRRTSAAWRPCLLSPGLLRPRYRAYRDCGKLVAEAIAGIAGASTCCADSTPQFPGGTGLRRPALVLAMLYYRLRDLL